jgi:hypothetical protein
MNNPRFGLREDELFAAIATKIIEFAGLDDKAPWISVMFEAAW